MRIHSPDRGCGQHRRSDAEQHAEREQSEVFGQDHGLDLRFLESHGRHQGEFTAALENIALDHQAQTHASQEQTQTTQPLEGVQVGVLDGVEAVQPVHRGRGFQAQVGQATGQCLSDGFLVAFGVDEEGAVAVFAGEMAQEFGL